MSDRIDNSQWQRLGELFDQAIDLDAAGRAGLLRAVEAEDAELAQALASLLAADAKHQARTAEHRGRLLQGALDAVEVPDVAVGDRVGPYVLREELGRGGMGVVFRAERADGQVRQEVALKVVKLGMDTREVIGRFEAERQALAMMDHPHIARMFDAGATASGRPYFVMELVDGEPISDYCTGHNLPIAQRLQLFDQVCAAVQHAHTKGIIHRDLKPNNVLVITQDGQPFAKVIDFGIAKATSGRLTEKTLLTEQFLMMGTALYMSPEQAAGSADIDTRTDIYALGVILYELLTDTTPIDSNSLRTAAHAEVQRIIREVDPPRPSVRLSQSVTTRRGAAEKQGADPRLLARTVRGELDWIVMKAIEKDRARRYETASALAQDVRRYLVGEAVLAAPPGAVYRLRKLIGRNKGAVAAGSMIATALLVGIVAFAWQARIAQQRANEVEQVAQFEGDMLERVDPPKAGKQLMDNMKAKLSAALVKAGVAEKEREGQAATFADLLQHVNATDTARDLIDVTILKPAVRAVGRRFKDQPVVAARLDQVLADRYFGMGLFDAAMPLQQDALAIRRRVLGEEHPDTLQSVNRMGVLLIARGRPREAEPFIRDTLAKSRRVLGNDHPITIDAIRNLGQLLDDEGKLAEAERYDREALERNRRVRGEENRETVNAINNIGALLLGQGKLGEAEPYLREGLTKNRRVNGEDDASTLSSLNNLGKLLQAEGKLSEAEPYLREALEKRRRLLGEELPGTLFAIRALGDLLQAEGKLGEAEPLIREALVKSRQVLGEQNPDTLTSIRGLGALLLAEGKLSEAEPYFREALEKSHRVLGEDHPDTIASNYFLASLLQAEGKPAEAEPYIREALAKYRRVLGEERPDTIAAINVLGVVLQDQGKLGEAEPFLREAVEKGRRVLGAEHPRTLIYVSQLGVLLLAQGKFADAEKQLSPFEAASRKAFQGGNAVRLAAFLMRLGKARSGQGEFAAAQANLLEAQPILLQARGPKDKYTLQCTQALVDLYTAWNAKEPGKGYDAKAVEWKRKRDAAVAASPAAAG